MYYRLIYLDKNFVSLFSPISGLHLFFNGIYFQRSDVLFGEVSSLLYFKDFMCIFMCVCVLSNFILP